MRNIITDINKANNANKNYQKSNLSLIGKKLTVLDSDISRLYKKYSIAKKVRLNQEKEQINIINRIKYLEDEEKKMQLKCKHQMQKINSLTQKLAEKICKQKYNNNIKINKSFFRNEVKIKNKGEDYKFNSSLNDYTDSKIHFKNRNKEDNNMLNISLIDKIHLSKRDNLNTKTISKNGKKKNKDYCSNESSIYEVKAKLNNSFILPKSNHFFKDENNGIDKDSFLSKDYTYINTISKNKKYKVRINYKKKPINIFKVNIYSNENMNKMIHSLKEHNIKRYNRNNSSIISKKNKLNYMAKTLTTNNIVSNEKIYKKIKELNYSRSIEAKREKLGISSEKKIESKDNNQTIKKIKIIKKKSKINDKKDRYQIKSKNNKFIIDKEFNGKDNISYDFIINDDKIYYNINENVDKINNCKDSMSENDFNNNYIFRKNEEKIKNILYNNKNSKNI